MINRTVRERVLDVMRSAGRALSQAEVAKLTGDLAPSVRRTMQKLEKGAIIRHKGYVDHNLQRPTFVLASTPDPNAMVVADVILSDEATV